MRDPAEAAYPPSEEDLYNGRGGEDDLTLADWLSSMDSSTSYQSKRHTMGSVILKQVPLEEPRHFETRGSGAPVKRRHEGDTSETP